MLVHSDKLFFGEFKSKELVEEVKNILRIHDKYPEALFPLRGMNDNVNKIFNKIGFELIPTVPSTTVLKKLKSDKTWFLKIYHPLKLKNKLLEGFYPRAKRTFQKTSRFLQYGLNTSEPLGWCYLRRLNKSIFIMDEVKGLSLYDILIRKKTITDKNRIKNISEKLLNELCLCHSRGIFFGDLHLGHIYPEGDRLYFIDLDSVIFKKHLRYDDIAKNLAGLNHPLLPLSKEERLSFLYNYAMAMNMEMEILLEKIKQLTKKRYKR